MTTPARQARENAISFEVKKDGLQQRQSGDWVLRLTVQAVEMDQRITTAPMGTRFVCALVEVGDDEMPVDHKAMDRDKWRALGPAKQSGIRCKDPVFWAYLRENAVGYGERATDEDSAARIVRDACNVLTRSDLGKPGFSDQRVLWFELDMKFQAWKARENLA
jgi:hypothetical protein